ncbi:PEP-CTERM sorting domain-containing protein [Massilia sp. METH4]|uniref:PEP-CTERM sorting domain-containing protein n=1 Tax=Massilia sp. METH4 TaxID=3123041 RepID=UPI0030CAA9CE
MVKLALASTLSLAAAAQAEVVTFDGTAGTDLAGASHVVSGVYTYFRDSSVYQGYTFTAEGHWYAGEMNTMVFCGGSRVNCAFDGTDHLIASPVLAVRRADGNPFSLNAFDLGNTHEGFGEAAEASFAVIGYKADGTTISTTVTLDDLPNSATYGSGASLNHFDFAGFTDLRAVEIARITPNAWGMVTLDNLDVTAVTPVPEPSAWLMMGLGLLGLGVHAKRHKA